MCSVECNMFLMLITCVCLHAAAAAAAANTANVPTEG